MCIHYIFLTKDFSQFSLWQRFKTRQVNRKQTEHKVTSCDFTFPKLCNYFVRNSVATFVLVEEYVSCTVNSVLYFMIEYTKFLSFYT